MIEALLLNNQIILDNKSNYYKKKMKHTIPKKYKRCQIYSVKGIQKDLIYYCLKCNEQLGLYFENGFEEYLKEK